MPNILYENVVSAGRARPTISPHAPPGGWEVHGAKKCMVESDASLVQAVVK